jgi:6-phosphogluconolactonase/glucosamine-6-phosphate isomerase/deaminase
VADACAGLLGERPDLRMCLATGQTPLPVYAELAGGLDLAVLGLGGNGHLGMNEPGSPATARTHRVELAPATVEAAAGYLDDRPGPAGHRAVGPPGLHLVAGRAGRRPAPRPRS